MTPRILSSRDDSHAFIYNTQTEIPMGRLIWARRDLEMGSSEVAEKFIEYCGGEVPESLHEWEYQWAMFQESLTNLPKEE